MFVSFCGVLISFLHSVYCIFVQLISVFFGGAWSMVWTVCRQNKNIKELVIRSNTRTLISYIWCVYVVEDLIWNIFQDVSCLLIGCLEIFSKMFIFTREISSDSPTPGVLIWTKMLIFAGVHVELVSEFFRTETRKSYLEKQEMKTKNLALYPSDMCSDWAKYIESLKHQ